MGYNPNIPNPTDLLSNSQGQIKTNFTSANSVYGGDHYAFDNVTANASKHKRVIMPGGSLPVNVANDGVIYTKTTASVTDLYYSPDATGREYQLTKTIDGSFTRFATNTTYSGTNNGGWTFLPGGLLLQYGRFTSPGNSGTITYPVVFPSGNRPFTISLTLERASGNQSISIDSGTTPTATSFDFITSSAGSVAINWVAIGN